MRPKVVGVLLAAGSATRFGSNKLLHLLPDGVPVAVSAARALQQGVDQVIAVIPVNDRYLSKALEAVDVRCIENPFAKKGMASSLAAGIHASPDAKGWIIALADMPWVQPETIRQIKQRLSKGASLVAPVYNGRRGHPVCFSADWKNKLTLLEGDRGAKTLINQNPDKLELVYTQDSGVLQDIDRPEDVKRIMTKIPDQTG